MAKLQQPEAWKEKAIKIFSKKTLWKRVLVTIAAIGAVAFFIFVDQYFKYETGKGFECGTKTHLDPTRK